MRRTKSLEDKIQGQISKYGDLFSVEYDENGFSVSCTICEKEIRGNERTVRTLLRQHIITRRHRTAVQQVVRTQGTVSQSVDDEPLDDKECHCHTGHSEYQVDMTPLRGHQGHKSSPSMATVGTIEHRHPSSDLDSDKTSIIEGDFSTADSDADREAKKWIILKLRSQIRRNEAEATFYESVTDRLDTVLNTIVESLLTN